MPKKDAICKVIQRSRNDNRAAPPQPADRASIILPDAYRMYEVAPDQMEDFLLWDSGVQDESRNFLFGRPTVKW